jgi:hypothetical protein
MNGSRGFAFVLNGRFLRLKSFSSLFTAELFALCKALEAVGNFLPGKCLLCTYFLSVIQGYLTHSLILELCTTSHTLSEWDSKMPQFKVPWYLVSSVWTYKPFSIDASWPNSNSIGTTQVNKLRDVKRVSLPWKSSCCFICWDEVVVARLRVGHSHQLSANYPLCVPLVM